MQLTLIGPVLIALVFGLVVAAVEDTHRWQSVVMARVAVTRLGVRLLLLHHTLWRNQGLAMTLIESFMVLLLVTGVGVLMLLGCVLLELRNLRHTIAVQGSQRRQWVREEHS